MSTDTRPVGRCKASALAVGDVFRIFSWNGQEDWAEVTEIHPSGVYVSLDVVVNDVVKRWSTGVNAIVLVRRAGGPS